MFAGELAPVIVASLKVPGAESRAGTNPDLWPAPFRRPGTRPSVQDTSEYPKNGEEP